MLFYLGAHELFFVAAVAAYLFALPGLCYLLARRSAGRDQEEKNS